MSVASLAVLRRTTTVGLVLVAALALTACVDQPTPEPEPTGTATPTPTVTDEPTTAPTETPDPLDIACADLVDPDVIYAFDPNYALIGAWTPDAGTPAARAAEMGGVLCRWVRESGNSTIDLFVARPGQAESDALKNEAFAAGEMVPTYDAEGYFDLADGRGTATVFPGSYWLVISSESFAEPGEPAEIIRAAIAALPAS